VLLPIGIKAMLDGSLAREAARERNRAAILNDLGRRLARAIDRGTRTKASGKYASDPPGALDAVVCQPCYSIPFWEIPAAALGWAKMGAASESGCGFRMMRGAAAIATVAFFAQRRSLRRRLACRRGSLVKVSSSVPCSRSCSCQRFVLCAR